MVNDSNENEDSRQDIPEGGLAGNTEDGRQEDIQSLLDLGYEQLDGFRVWVEEVLQLGTRISEQDCFNAECLVDHLANHYHKGLVDINEFELRWFMFSHYIRKAMADEETEERLPESLQRFFDYLRREHSELVPAWIDDVLEDTVFYQNRRQTYAALDGAEERAWEQGFSTWCLELEDDLDTRCLWLPRHIGNGMEWNIVMGWREATLYSEANENWQRERDRLLLQGMDFESAREYLTESFDNWLSTPQSRLEDMSPFEVILSERMDRTEESHDGSEEENVI